MAAVIVQSSEGDVDQTVQLVCGTVDGLVHGCGMMRHRDRLAAFESGFQHAAHVFITAFLVAILIAQLDFHSRDVIAESLEGVLHGTSDLSGQ